MNIDKPFVFIVIIPTIIVLTISFFSITEYSKKSCEDFKNYRIRNIPARCLDYYFKK